MFSGCEEMFEIGVAIEVESLLKFSNIGVPQNGNIAPDYYNWGVFVRVAWKWREIKLGQKYMNTTSNFEAKLDFLNMLFYAQTLYSLRRLHKARKHLQLDENTDNL